MPSIRFHGAAGTVTGSCYQLQSSSGRVLIDCGLFQGRKSLRERNWGRRELDARTIDRVVLTHAHLDHAGWIPRLIANGFRGPVHCTPASADLLDFMLEDSARIQEEDARYANRKGFSKHKPARPLYTVEDAKRAVDRIEVVPFGEWQELLPDLRYRHRLAGHIIGSSQLEVEIQTDAAPLRMVFSGDVGRYDAPLVTDPSEPPTCDVLLCESTYGDRTHPDTPVEGRLQELLKRVMTRGGVLLVAAFSVGRSQQLMYLLNRVMEGIGRHIPIHLDSPMAVDTTRIYERYPEEAGLETLDLRSASTPIYGSSVYLHKSAEESKRLNHLEGPRVIIASSGMMTGGRILHHLRARIGDPKNLVVLGGYQAPGTRGWRLQRGERRIRVHGRDLEVRAEIETVSGLSAHADRDELIRWLRPLAPPRRTFVVHGEPEAAEAFARRLEEELGHRTTIPKLFESYELSLT